jgi:ribosomal small subunit protein bTHX
MGLSARRNVAARGPTCLLAPGQMSSALPALAEPLTVLAGRGDKRTKRGKRKSHSFGNVRYPPFVFYDILEWPFYSSGLLNVMPRVLRA